jgi:hypothetical protein
VVAAARPVEARQMCLSTASSERLSFELDRLHAKQPFPFGLVPQAVPDGPRCASSSER